VCVFNSNEESRRDSNKLMLFFI